MTADRGAAGGRTIPLTVLLIVLALAAGCTTSRSAEAAGGASLRSEGRLEPKDLVRVTDLLVTAMFREKSLWYYEVEAPVISVGSIRYLPPFTEQYADIVLGNLESGLVRKSLTGVVVNRDYRPVVRAEQLDQQKYVLEESAVSLAREKGANLILLCSINTIEEKKEWGTTRAYTFILRLIDIEKNTLLWVGSETVLVEEKVSRAGLVSTTLLSAAVPGTGQLINGKYGRGSIMLGLGAAFLGVGIYSFAMSGVNLEESQNAVNDTNKDYYYGQYVNSMVIGFGALGGYLLTGVWSAIDNYVQKSRELKGE